MRLRSRRTLTLSLATLLATASAAASTAPASALPTRAPIATRLGLTLAQFVHAHPTFPGVAVAVRAPGLAWSGAAGLADRSSRTPLTTAAPFRIASVTKTFTAAAILRLAENGKLTLDDPIGQHLSSYTVALLRHGGYDVSAIGVRNLLQHTSGLHDYADDPAYQTFVLGHPRHR